MHQTILIFLAIVGTERLILTTHDSAATECGEMEIHDVIYIHTHVGDANETNAFESQARKDGYFQIQTIVYCDAVLLCCAASVCCDVCVLMCAVMGACMR